MPFTELLRLVGRVIKYPLFTIQGQAITAMDLATFTVVVVATLLVSRVLTRSALGALSRRGVDDQGTRTIARRLIHYAVLAVGFGTAISNLGVNLSTIFAAGAVLGVGLGFAFQSVAQNFISGLLLLFERSIRPGDVLEVEGRVVRVEDLRIRSTVARTRDDEQLIIPNSTLAQNTVVNYTMNDALFRIRVPVGVTYDSDLNRVREVLERTAAAGPWGEDSREPIVLLTGFGSSSVDFEISVWTDDPWGSTGLASELHEAVWWALKREGIVIAFPQLDVHLAAKVEESIARLPRAS
jgi:small-conductance mechanosensitive channel